ncbi:MAG: 3-oxoacyl-ACP reductase [Glaciihabitans sp.]|nr:3-oxoacyl-ACP reductase [Glaciihabitans sp.]
MTVENKSVGLLDRFSLSGRRALVTGGNRGLGLAFVRGLAQAGAEVAFVARDHERNNLALEELANEGIAAIAFDADITEKSQIEDSIDWASEALGGIDILVNNAGACFHADAFDVPDDEWDAVFDLNVKALFHCSVAVARRMAKSGGGSIVNIGSMSGLIVNRPQNQPAYNASKAAVHQLTKSLAAEWAQYGVRVNAVAPGYVRTEMAPVDRPEFKRFWIEDAPLGRVATPDEIAPSVVFLASDASSFITGSVLVADGGYTAW